MPRRDGVAATDQVMALGLDVTVVALTTFDSGDLVQSALEAGASGYLLKSTAPAELAAAVTAAHRTRRPKSAVQI